jgi:hypothetical protein
MIVVCPTSTPGTSVIALSFPGGSMPMLIPSSLARLFCACIENEKIIRDVRIRYRMWKDKKKSPLVY